ncbi:MAG: hypothetical protein IV090_27520, partial [Candidatus Sericytochromatia bacterium]|nr:hypothetical protein [Candidatus Sericytochromatia bacterium]
MSMEHLTVFISPQPLPVEVQSPTARPATPSSFHFWLEQQRSSIPQRQPAPVKPPVQPLHIPVRTPVQSAHPVFQPIRTQPALKPFKADPDKTPDKDISVSKAAQKQPLSQVLKVEVTGLLLIESPSTQSPLKTEPSEPPAPEESPDQTALFWASLAFEALSRQMQPLGFGQVTPQPQAPALGFGNQSANQDEDTQTISAAEPAQTPELLGFASALPLKLQVTFNYQLLFFVALRSPRKAASTESENAALLNSDNLGAEVTEQPTEAVQAPVAPGAFSSEPDFTDANAEDQTDSNSPASSHPTPTPVVQAPAVETPAAPASVAQAPAVEAPAAPTPVAQAPAVEAPEAPAPVAQAPAVEAPVAPAPVAQAPAVEAPAAPAPVAQAPAVEAPVAPAPVAQAPAVEAPVAPA